MKKTINRKSYNTEYDSECICKYTDKVDGWAETDYWIFRKKSTGEYFEYSKWGQWNDSWDIKMISEENVKKVLKERKAGMTHKYVAMMANFPGTRSKGYFWGTKDDDPWDEDNIKKKKEEEKKKREQEKRDLEERKKKIIEKEEKDADGGEKVYGVLEITRCSEGKRFKTAYDKAVPADKIGKVLYYDINYRIKNSNFSKGVGYNGWYRYSSALVLENGDKESAKKLFIKIKDDVVREQGELEAVMKGGEFVETPKNDEIVEEINRRLKEWDEKVIWGKE